MRFLLNLFDGAITNAVHPALRTCYVLQIKPGVQIGTTDNGENHGTCIRWQLRTRCARLKENGSFFENNFYLRLLTTNIRSNEQYPDYKCAPIFELPCKI